MPDDLLALEQMLLESGAGDDKATPRRRKTRTASGCSSARYSGLDRQAASRKRSAVSSDGTALSITRSTSTLIVDEPPPTASSNQPASTNRHTDLTAGWTRGNCSKVEQVDNNIAVFWMR